MAAPARRLATYADLLALPDDVRAEVLAGEIVTSLAPLPRHSRTQRALGHFVGGPFDDDDGHGGPGGWWIFSEVDIQLTLHDVVRPDLAGWRRANLSKPGDQRPFTIPPDWICEVLSRSTAARDRGIKRDLYARSGIPYYWLIDAEARLLEAFELRDGRWSLVGTYDDSSVARIEPFAAIELPVGRLFLPRESDEIDE